MRYRRGVTVTNAFRYFTVAVLELRWIGVVLVRAVKVFAMMGRLRSDCDFQAWFQFSGERQLTQRNKSGMQFHLSSDLPEFPARSTGQTTIYLSR